MRGFISTAVLFFVPLAIVSFYILLFLGEFMPGAIPFCLALAAILVYFAIRHTPASPAHGKYPIRRLLYFVCAAYVVILPILGYVAGNSRNIWHGTVKEDNCGVRIGMSQVEVHGLADLCGQAMPTSFGYFLKPKGLSKLSLFSGVCKLNIKYNNDATVQRVSGHCSSK